MGHRAEVLGQLWFSGICRHWRDVAVPGWWRPECGSPCGRDAPGRGPAPQPPSAGGTGGLGPYLQHPGGLGTQQGGGSGRRESAVPCWHLPSSESSVLISLRLPGRGREVALEWGGLARASIFNELDIYFSPSWLPPHRSLCHPPGLLFSPCQQLHGSRERAGRASPALATSPLPGSHSRGRRDPRSCPRVTCRKVGGGEGSPRPLRRDHLRVDHPMGMWPPSSREKGGRSGSTLGLGTGFCLHAPWV